MKKQRQEVKEKLDEKVHHTFPIRAKLTVLQFVELCGARDEASSFISCNEIYLTFRYLGVKYHLRDNYKTYHETFTITNSIRCQALWYRLSNITARRLLLKTEYPLGELFYTQMQNGKNLTQLAKFHGVKPATIRKLIEEKDFHVHDARRVNVDPQRVKRIYAKTGSINCAAKYNEVSWNKAKSLL